MANSDDEEGEFSAKELGPMSVLMNCIYGKIVRQPPVELPETPGKPKENKMMAMLQSRLQGKILDMVSQRRVDAQMKEESVEIYKAKLMNIIIQT